MFVIAQYGFRVFMIYTIYASDNGALDELVINIKPDSF